MDGIGKVEMLFRRRENRLEETYRAHMQGDLEERVAKLAELQNDKGYMVEWEKDPETENYRIQEFNCPISQVAREFNQACNCELSLFRRVLDANVEQTSCMAKGGDKCVFEVKQGR
jgi:predicted ArsR family transcriptional regulator